MRNPRGSSLAECGPWRQQPSPQAEPRGSNLAAGGILSGSNLAGGGTLAKATSPQAATSRHQPRRKAAPSAGSSTPEARPAATLDEPLIETYD
jgi:hypothetical protein